MNNDEKYKELLFVYEKETNSEKYKKIIREVPYEFLNAIQLCEQLNLIDKIKSINIHMNFNDADDAYNFYYNIVSFKKDINELIEKANYILKIQELKDNLNQFVNENNLNSLLQIDNGIDELVFYAKIITDILPNYPKLLSTKFRINFIESCIIALDVEELNTLCERKVILAQDISKISLVENTDNYINKVNSICDYYNLPHIQTENLQFSLKGTSYPNEDGSSRQDNIKLLNDFIKENPNIKIELDTKPFIFHNPKTNQDESAILYTWNNRGIGCAPREIATEIYENIKSPQFITYLNNIRGGKHENSLYGCGISTNIYTSEPYEKSLNKDENDKDEIER